MTSPKAPTGRKTSAQGKEHRDAALGPPPPQNPSPEGAAHMPVGWMICRFADVANVISGKNQKEVESPSGIYPIYGSGGTFGRATAYLCEAGTTVIGRKGTINSPIFVNERFWNVDTAFGLFPIDPELLAPRLLHYFCRLFDFSALDKSTTIPSLAKRDIEIIPFPLPPLNEQKRIVSKIEELFSELDAGEGSLRRARRQLGVYHQSLLKQAFEAKLTAPWRKQNPHLLESPDQLLNCIQEERQARYEEQIKVWESVFEKWEGNGENGKRPTKPRAPKDSDPMGQGELRHLADLPTGWTYARLSESIVNIDAGKSFSCDERPPSAEEIGVAKVSAVTWGEYDESESKTCREASKIVPEYFIKPGDFLLSRANTIELVGAVVIVKRTTKHVMLSDKTLRVNFAGIDPNYILQYLRCRTGRLEIMVRSSGNQESMRNIGQDRVGAIITPLCSLPEQQEIVRLLDEQFTVIEQNEREIDAALKRSAALRQSILKKVFTGQLVPQDPADEPASALLERIRKERAATPSTTSRRTKAKK